MFRVQTEKARNNPKATVPNLSALFKKVFKSERASFSNCSFNNMEVL